MFLLFVEGILVFVADPPFGNNALDLAHVGCRGISCQFFVDCSSQVVIVGAVDKDGGLYEDWAAFFSRN